jgi:hypothetical protein
MPARNSWKPAWPERKPEWIELQATCTAPPAAALPDLLDVSLAPVSLVGAEATPLPLMPGDFQ